MSWIPIARTPITMVPTSERQARRFFRGKPHALAFLASGMLVVGESHGLTLHDPEVESDEPALLDVGGGVRWMVAHTDGSSVIAAVSGPTGCAIVRAWPAERRVVTLHRTSSFGYGFSGACAPDGTQLCWLEASHPPTLHTLDATSGALVRSVELPPETAGNGSFAVGPDGAVYLKSKNLLIVHPDGSKEPRNDGPFFMAPSPLLITGSGSIIGAGGEVVDRAGDAFVHGRSASLRAHVGTHSADRTRVTFHAPLGEVTVLDVPSMEVVFRAEQRRATGRIPGWAGQSAASSASHVAAIDHGDATVQIWRIREPETTLRRIEGYCQGARRLMFQEGALTVHTSQPPNTLDSILEIALDDGATRRLERAEVHDMARTSDGHRLLVLHNTGPMRPCAVSLFDATGAATRFIEVQRGGELLALSPDDAVWGVVSHTYPAGRSDPTCHVQWRPFGAARWSKTLKLKGYWPRLALGATAAITVVGEALVVTSWPGGKQLHSTPLPRNTNDLAISPGVIWAALACHDKLRVMNVASNTLLDAPVKLPVDAPPTAVCFQDDHTLFAGHASGAITRHRAIDGEQLGVYLAHTDAIRTLKWHDGSLWSGSEDGTILQLQL
jgi:hypothetical protein